jgi:hypothetical protein
LSPRFSSQKLKFGTAAHFFFIHTTSAWASRLAKVEQASHSQVKMQRGSGILPLECGWKPQPPLNSLTPIRVSDPITLVIRFHGFMVSK